MEDLEYLISYLAEKKNVACVIPEAFNARLGLYHSLSRGITVSDIDDEFFIAVQDRFLQNMNKAREPVSLSDIAPFTGNIYVWKGDVTRLEVDAIVNGTGENMLGYFSPCSQCIEDSLHFYSGFKLEEAQSRTKSMVLGTSDDGSVIITSAYNLPAKFVIHTNWSEHLPDDLSAKDDISILYGKCLHLAWLNSVKSIAFTCMLSPLEEQARVDAARTAISAVNEWLEDNPNYPISVVFNVLTEEDKKIFEKLLS